jgi:hypothetical protein
LGWFYGKPQIIDIAMASGGGIPFPPLFYAGRELKIINIQHDCPLAEINDEIANKHIHPTHIIVTGTAKKEELFRKLSLVFPNKKFQLEATFTPGLVDNIAYWLNPTHNVNETWFVYSIQ